MKNALPNNLFFEQVEQLISIGQSVQIPLKGYSMRPFIPDGYKVVLHPCTSEELQPGEIVLFRYHNSYILHRIIRREKDQLLLQGDGNYKKWEKAKVSDVIAIVHTVLTPSGRSLSTHSISWRIRSYCWVKLHPLRRYILAIYNRWKK